MVISKNMCIAFDEKQECIDEIIRLRDFENTYRTEFYSLELYDDLALYEMKARDLGISDGEIESKHRAKHNNKATL